MRATALLLIGTLLPCGLAAAEPRVTDAVLGEGKVDKADGFEIVKPTSVFHPNTLEKSLALPFLNSGSFSLSKPNNGFPVGAYRLEIYFGSKLVKTLKFSVQAP